MHTDYVLNEIKEERKKQDAKWGEQNHSPAHWLMILGEEVGEVNKAALEAKFSGKDLAQYREELIQVAAVAVAMIECLDRNMKHENRNLLLGDVRRSTSDFKKEIIRKLTAFYAYGDEHGYSNAELSRIRSCITKVEETSV